MELEKVLERLEESVSTELEKLAKKPELNPAEIKAACDACCLIEKIRKIQNGGMDDEEYGVLERSPDPYKMNGSYARSRSMRTGRYVSNSNGYSRHSIRDRIVDNLEKMMDSASSDYERNVISGWIAKVESE